MNEDKDDLFETPHGFGLRWRRADDDAVFAHKWEIMEGSATGSTWIGDSRRSGGGAGKGRRGPAAAENLGRREEAAPTTARTDAALPSHTRSQGAWYMIMDERCWLLGCSVLSKKGLTPANQTRAKAKFDETFDVVVKLGIDPKRGDQMVRGMAALPHGTGKQVRVALFTMGTTSENVAADVIGGEELIERIRNGKSPDFDKCVATPDMMPKLAKIAKILGPKGLMPNPKLGTVTQDVEGAIDSLKRGKIEFRNDRGGLIHVGVGKLSFSDAQIQENVHALVDALLAARPKGIKGGGANRYLTAAYVSSTMGSAIPVTVPSLVQQRK
uniref:Ribosomal protein n=1 Tax=Picocystis salinarum TaxID=88271 RepID=A0A7S3UBP3_9CHLO|mmetsp:Transcript_2418/g.16277  ORF Transcript_2418/g.16277 Transcript_2418/m.16277 type:complete len:327 (+) Transcript_2418:3-983(+)